jgi:hypothetical protein
MSGFDLSGDLARFKGCLAEMAVPFMIGWLVFGALAWWFGWW